MTYPSCGAARGAGAFCRACGARLGALQRMVSRESLSVPFFPTEQQGGGLGQLFGD